MDHYESYAFLGNLMVYVDVRLSKCVEKPESLFMMLLALNNATARDCMKSCNGSFLADLAFVVCSSSHSEGLRVKKHC